MIFVSGGTGFIGAHLLLHLIKKGEQIIAAKRIESKLDYFERLCNYYQISEAEKNQIKWTALNLLNPPEIDEALAACTVIYHCAGLISFDERDWDKLLKTNRNITANLVNSALNNGIKDFCYLSSVAALDMSKGIKGKKTDWKYFRKHQPYGYSKYLGELEVYRGKEEGLNVKIINPAVVMGPCDHSHPQYRTLKRLQKGLNYYPTGSNAFVSVDEVCEAMLQAISNDDPAEEAQIVAGTAMSFKELLQMLSTELGVKAPAKPLNSWRLQLLFLAAKVAALFPKGKSALNLASIRSLSRNKDYNEYKNHYRDSNSLEKLKLALKKSVDFFN